MARVTDRRIGRSCRAVAAASVLLAFTAACSSGGGRDANAATACPTDALDGEVQPVAIDFWHSMTGTNATVLGEMVDAYNSSQSQVKVTLTYQGTYSESLSKYIAALRGGALPDIMQTEETAMQLMVDSNSTVIAQSCVDASGYDISDYIGEVLSQYRISGVLVTMPFQLSNPVLYYNRSSFTKAGLDPDAPPTTFEELISMSQTLVDTKAVKTAALSLDAFPWVIEQWMAMAGAPVVDNDNGRTDRATSTLFNSDPGTRAFAVLGEMVAKGLIAPATSDELAKYLAVATGDTAMTIGSSASLGTIYDQIDRFPGVEIGVGPLPGPTGGGITVGGGSLWMVDKSPDADKAAAWDFQTWLNEPDQQVRWAVGTGYIPTRASVSSDPALLALWADRPGFKVAFDQLADAPLAPGGGSPVIGDYEGVRAAVGAAMESVLAGGDPGQAVATMQADATKAIADYNRRVGG